MAIASLGRRGRGDVDADSMGYDEVRALSTTAVSHYFLMHGTLSVPSVWLLRIELTGNTKVSPLWRLTWFEGVLLLL